TNNMLVPTAGIDESNADGNYILWPKNPQKSANAIREYLSNQYQLRDIGVVITDSKTTPLRWGVTGIALAHSGFLALNNYIGVPDIFGRKLEHTKVNVADSLAAAAAFVMGEGAEQMPMAILSDLPQVVFQQRNPTEQELQELHIHMEDDLYAPFLNAVSW